MGWPWRSLVAVRTTNNGYPQPDFECGPPAWSLWGEQPPRQAFASEGLNWMPPRRRGTASQGNLFQTDKLSRGGLGEKRDNDSQARTETPRNHSSLLTNKERPTRYARTAYHKDRGAMFEP
ncbi:hypothetical protein FCULG_00001642 [Fusarium culmorum]|uniref:Uncharacterized protein n=1 Tax=Fusarium culmorum TaxID=5516 RepID=A0A2T4GQQ0_FUSCU|nr:hypothetical protein FCULG_00001642 [Fusarium culmorum]